MILSTILEPLAGLSKNSQAGAGGMIQQVPYLDAVRIFFCFINVQPIE